MAEAKLIGLLSGHLVLTGLPAVAAALVAARHGTRRLPVLLAVALACSGCFAMLSFWSFYWDPTVGKTVAFLVPAASIAAIWWALRGGRVGRDCLTRLATPFGLWVFGTFFLVFLGFLHGGSTAPIYSGANRFTWPLPQDNILPRYFANWFYVHGHHGTPPLYGDWLASDRPPLQIGYVLSQRPFGWDRHGLHYQLLGVALQQLWIVGLYALLDAAGLGRITRALTLLAVLASDFAIVNGFYVWPKPLPAAMLLAAAALVVTPGWRDARRAYGGAALIAALCALAMLRGLGTSRLLSAASRGDYCCSATSRRRP